ncbi:hypothetical protein MN608_06810 [Microdochium nivale]|nr:hypothetical protein MN608_06810 [Microdochium nivale]
MPYLAFLLHRSVPDTIKYMARKGRGSVGRAYILAIRLPVLPSSQSGNKPLASCQHAKIFLPNSGATLRTMFLKRRNADLSRGGLHRVEPCSTCTFDVRTLVNHQRQALRRTFFHKLRRISLVQGIAN